MAVLNTHKPHTVYTRSSWTDAWVATPYLYANGATIAVAPSTSSAELQYDYGHKIRAGNLVAETYTPLDIVGRYVKIAIDGGDTWYGGIIEVENERLGEQDVNGVAVLTGTQRFICRGLEFLLQREPILTSVVKTDAGEQTIGRAIAFNLGAGLPGSAYREDNMSPDIGAQSFVFAKTLQGALPWQSHQILDYLVAYQFPRTINGFDNIGWTFDANIALQYLSPYKPALHIHGKTAFQVLNELIDRRRLLSWYVYVDPLIEVPEIRIFSFNRDAIALPEVPNVIIENQNQIDNWDYDQDNLVQRSTLATDYAARFNRVYVKGEPPGSVFTVSVQTGLLETDWTTAQQTTYRTGATADPAYAGYDDWQKHDANQQARTKDSLKKPFRYFRISPTGFTGTIGGKPVWPRGSKVVDGNDESLIATAFWYPGLRLQDKLPLRLEHDYTNPVAVTNEMKANSKWEYQRPFAYHYEGSGRAYFLDRMSRGESVGTHAESSGRFWSCALRMQDDAFGIILDVHGGPQHIIGKNSFTPIDTADEVDYEAGIDYSYIYATVYAEGDGNVTVQWPTQPVVPDDTVKDLIIHAPNCRLDYLVPGTTIDIDNEGAPVTSLGGFIQDDTDHMKNIARSAYEWYNQPRKAIGVSFHDLGFQQSANVVAVVETIYLGSLVRAIGGANNAETVNSVVSQISYDLLAGTTTFLTQFAELDFV